MKIKSISTKDYIDEVNKINDAVNRREIIIEYPNYILITPIYIECSMPIDISLIYKVNLHSFHYNSRLVPYTDM